MTLLNVFVVRFTSSRKAVKELRTTQHSMERKMIVLTLRDRKTAEWIGVLTGVADI